MIDIDGESHDGLLGIGRLKLVSCENDSAKVTSSVANVKSDGVSSILPAFSEPGFHEMNRYA